MRIEGLSFKGWRRKNGDLDQLRFLKKFTMKDTFDRQAFIPVQEYGTAENTVAGEIGHIIDFRIVEVQDMFRWESAGDHI